VERLLRRLSLERLNLVEGLQGRQRHQRLLLRVCILPRGLVLVRLRIRGRGRET
jgi:hypothetical protein